MTQSSEAQVKYHQRMPTHIVVAEDDPLQAELLRRYLEAERYRVTTVADGREVLEVTRREQPDLLLLDIMLPRVDGLDICRILRAETDMPILMVTARTTEDDILLGLDLGADDYITKPYSPRQLVARVRTVLRRFQVSHDSDRVSVAGTVTIDPARHEARVRGELVAFTRAEFRLLEMLSTNAGLVFSRGQLLEHMHGSDRFITERTVDVHVRNIRAKIEADPSDPRLLLTVYGVGYKFVDSDPVSNASR